jgi:hypothetical protein
MVPFEQTSNIYPEAKPMSLPACLAQASLDTVLGRLALLFLTGALGDLSAARHAAGQMLAAYGVQAEDELSLTGEIISFGFHAMEALSQAADPNLSLNQKLRLRGSAVSMSREGHKAQRKLDQLQRQRRTSVPSQTAEARAPTPAAQPEAEPNPPKTDPAASLPATSLPAASLVEFAREAIQAAGKKYGAKNWTRSFQQREAAKRIAANLKKNASRFAQSNTGMAEGIATNAGSPAITGERPSEACDAGFGNSVDGRNSMAMTA